jgi:hypothetical protein
MNDRNADQQGAQLRWKLIFGSMSLVLLTLSGPSDAAAAMPKLDLHAVPVPAPTFSHLPAGWRAFSTPGELTPAGAQTSVFATSWPYRLATVDGPAGSMSANAVLVSVSLIRRNPGKHSGSLCRRTPRLSGYPPVRHLPVDLPATTAATLDGTAWPEYRSFGRLGNSYNFEVRVDISTRRPSVKLLRLARLAVAAIRFPRWPTPTTC